MDNKEAIHWHDVIGLSEDEIPQAARDAEERYGDIINREYPEPVNHPRMSREARAAQFAPFAALTGYDREVGQAEEKTLAKYSDPMYD